MGQSASSSLTQQDNTLCVYSPLTSLCDTHTTKHLHTNNSQKYVKGLVTVSAPFGGTTDQAITVRMGAVEWNINEWVKNPISRVAKELQAHVQVGDSGERWGRRQGVTAALASLC